MKQGHVHWQAIPIYHWLRSARSDASDFRPTT